MEVKKENPFLLYNLDAFRKENNGVDYGICTVYLENHADHSLRLWHHIFCLFCINNLEARTCLLCRTPIVDIVAIDPRAVVAAALLAINQTPNE